MEYTIEEKFQWFTHFVFENEGEVLLTKGRGDVTSLNSCDIYEDEIRIYLTDETALEFDVVSMDVIYFDWFSGEAHYCRHESVEDYVFDKKSVIVVINKRTSLTFFIK
jgi:hypothetical protein